MLVKRISLSWMIVVTYNLPAKFNLMFETWKDHLDFLIFNPEIIVDALNLTPKFSWVYGKLNK